MKLEKVIYIDADIRNADWTKRTWDLPPYKSEEFYELIPVDKLDEFRKRPVYQFAVESGLIVNDEWRGKT